MHVLHGHINWVRSVTFSPDGRLLASGGEDYIISLWDVQSSQRLRLISAHQDWIRVLTFRPDGLQLASGSDDRTIRLWETATGRCLHTLQ